LWKKRTVFRNIAKMAAIRRVALMLEFEWAYKRHADVFAGAQRYVVEHGWESTIDEYVDDTLADGPVYDGIIARANRRVVEAAARWRIPMVNVWATSPARERLPGVFPDWRAYGRMYAEHLLNRGIRRFAAVVSRPGRADELACEAFQTVVSEAGYHCKRAVIPLDFSRTQSRWRKMKQAIATAMDRWKLPIGVFAGADEVGRIAAQLCRSRGWRIPEDVAIVAGQNEETLCEHARPTLTSIELGFDRIGYEAARLLDKLMTEKEKANGRGGRNREAKPPEHLLIPPRALIVRESTDFSAVGDETVAAALRFISDNSHRPIGPDDVARAVLVHPKTLTNRFHQHLGRTIGKEIRRVRIERAKRELTLTDQSLDVIAQNVGFGERKRMYEVFKRELGVTPKQYRNERQVEEEG
jgi:LacI family transcriptional regulator